MSGPAWRPIWAGGSPDAAIASAIARAATTPGPGLRIADDARPGEVLVSQAVVDATEGVPVVFSEVGMVKLKGVSQAIRLHVARSA